MLAAGADHDASEIRAELHSHTQARNALRESQLEQGREMREGFATSTNTLSGTPRTVSTDRSVTVTPDYETLIKQLSGATLDCGQRRPLHNPLRH